MMIDLIQFKMDFILAFLLKLIQVNDFFENDFVVVFLVELNDTNSKVVWIQVNS